MGRLVSERKVKKKDKLFFHLHHGMFLLTALKVASAIRLTFSSLDKFRGKKSEFPKSVQILKFYNFEINVKYVSKTK